MRAEAQALLTSLYGPANKQLLFDAVDQRLLGEAQAIIDGARPAQRR